VAKRVVIIGAGVSGLSAGCYARMNGYDVEIHEAHTLPGGLCTSWKRGPYLIDGCISWLLGSGPASPYHRLYEELGIVQGRQICDFDLFVSVRGREGKTLHVYTDVDRFEAHLKELSPKDSRAAHKLCDLARRLARFSMPVGRPRELMSRFDSLKMFSHPLQLRDLMVASSWTMRDMGDWFGDSFLRTAISNLFGDPDMPALALIMTLGPMSLRAAGFPVGGSLEVARAIESRLVDLGGRIHYRSRVDKVLESGGRTTGVRLVDGEEVGADYVISACDLRFSLFSLLDGGRVDPVHKELLDTGSVYSPVVMVNFGANMDFSSELSCLGTLYELREPLDIAGRKLPYLGIKNFCYDHSTAPAGKSVVTVVIPTDWAFWERLATDATAYTEEKERIANLCREEIEERHPGFTSSIEMTDVATPLTFVRYAGNWHGTFMTWKLSNEFQRRHPYVPKTVPGLSGFYLASMWTNPPGGMPGATEVGRQVVQLMCHEDQKRFEASTP
jgi:phytoene dehydrogenase-like protein